MLTVKYDVTTCMDVTRMLSRAATDAGKCYATGVALGSAVSGDNCAVANVSNDAPAQFPKGDTTRSEERRVGKGSTATATQIVTVKEQENATISAPANLTDVATD